MGDSGDPTGGAASQGGASGLVLILAPVLVIAMLLVVLVSGVGATPQRPGCGTGGTAADFGDVTLTAEQMGNAQTIVAVTAGRQLPPYAAIVAVAASWTEVKLINDLTMHDHDSIGLFQIRVGFHGYDVASDPVRSTTWFLDALEQVPNWQTIPLTDAAAAVERPAAQYRGRYAAAQPLATAVVGTLWPAAAATGQPNDPPVDPPVDPPTDPSGGPNEPGVPCPTGPGSTGGTSTEAIPCTVGGTGQVETGPGSVPIRVCAVGPFVVDTTIASQVQAMLAAAGAAGLQLGGSGYRSNARQIELRRAHCGPTDYDIYQRPSRECSPPTAQPGESMHEWGLALDISNAGSLIRSHSDPAWQWLDAHAATYGLQNLPSEPWHWSTNGH